jgi:hypothetical protein
MRWPLQYRQPEVGDAASSIGHDEYVFRLDVAMCNGWFSLRIVIYAH